MPGLLKVFVFEGVKTTKYTGIGVRVKNKSRKVVTPQLRALGACFGKEELDGIGVGGLGEVVEGRL